MTHQRLSKSINQFPDNLSTKRRGPRQSFLTMLFKLQKPLMEFFVLANILGKDTFGRGNTLFEGAEKIFFFVLVVESYKGGPALAVGEEVFDKGRVIGGYVRGLEIDCVETADEGVVDESHVRGYVDNGLFQLVNSLVMRFGTPWDRLLKPS